MPRVVLTGPVRSKAQGAIALLKARAAIATKRLAHERIFGHPDRFEILEYHEAEFEWLLQNLVVARRKVS
jgi:hypothetical protein